MLVWERNGTEWTAAHPVVVRLVDACDNLEGMDEDLSVKKKRYGGARLFQSASGGTSFPWMDEDESSAGSAGSNSSANSGSATPAHGGGSTTTAQDAAQALRQSGTDLLLCNLIKSADRVVAFSKWCGLHPTRLLGVGIFLLDLLENPEGKFWEGVPTRTVRKAKEGTIDKYRRILNALSTVILTEVQYITASSQRLLNAYCLVYYRALAQSNALNLTIVLKCLRNAASELQNHSGFNAASFLHQGSFVPSSPAGRILQALQLIFHENLLSVPRNPVLSAPHTVPQPPSPHPDASASPGPSEDSLGPEEASSSSSVPSITISAASPDTETSSNSGTGSSMVDNNGARIEDTILGGMLTSRTALRDAFTSFAPGTMNAETAELVERVVDITEELDRELDRASRADNIDDFLDAVEMAKCVRWLRELVKWQRAGKQMEPVKDLLRRSMARIDFLRGVQRTYNIQFMD
ncbi:hypothetical protein HDU96_005993 [Phlyctochytrium bullatum]|nr:hypothetical protein HDU96_005993 [Phlyctochytrium bullatum]